MNQGFYGFPSNSPIPVGQFSHPILIDEMNCSRQLGPGSGQAAIPYYSALGFNIASNSAVPNNMLNLVAHWIGKPTLVREMVIGSVAPTVASNFIFGLFTSNQSSGFPENCLYSSHVANIPVSGSYGYSGVSCRVEIPRPGWYWAGSVNETNNAGQLQNASGANGGAISIYPNSGYSANFVGFGLRCGHTYGPMPSSLAARRMTLCESASGLPMTFLRLAPLNLTTTVPFGAPIA